MDLINVSPIQIIAIIAILLFGALLAARGVLSYQKFNRKGLAGMRNYRFSEKKFYFKIIILYLSFILVFFAMLRPEWGEGTRIVEAHGVDVVFTLDVSNSMRAMDIEVDSSVADRISASKYIISQFIEANPGNRYGLIIFAGEAFVSSPLTLDSSAFLTFLDNVDPTDVGKQGTDLGEALKMSLDRFESVDDGENRGKAVVLFSDGGEGVGPDFGPLGKDAIERAIEIFVVGIGSDEGAPIPEGQNFFGEIVYKQHDGKIVKTHLNEKPLKNIAEKSNGTYIHARKINDLSVLSEKLSNMNLTSIEQGVESAKQQRYQYFLLPSLILFLLHLLANPRAGFFGLVSGKFFKKFKIFPIILLTMILGGCTGDISFRYHNTKGNENFDKRYISEAKANYKKAEIKPSKKSFIASNNLAITEYDGLNFSEASKKISSVAESSCADLESVECADVFYNYGNILYRLGEESNDSPKRLVFWQKAIESYEKSLQINNNDEQAKENIEFIKNKMAEENQKQQDQNENSEEQNEDENKSEDSEQKESESNEQEQGGSGSKAEQELTDELDKKVEQYMEQMKVNQEQLKNFFHQNSNSIQEVGRNIFGQVQFKNRNNGVDKDW